MLAGIVAEGRMRGEIVEAANPETVASLIIAMLEGAAAICRLEKRHRALRSAREHLDAWLDSSIRLTAPAGPRRRRQIRAL